MGCIDEKFSRTTSWDDPHYMSPVHVVVDHPSTFIDHRPPRIELAREDLPSDIALPSEAMAAQGSQCRGWIEALGCPAVDRRAVNPRRPTPCADSEEEP